MGGGARLDHWARVLAASTSRRETLKAIAGFAGIGIAAIGLPDVAGRGAMASATRDRSPLVGARSIVSAPRTAVAQGNASLRGNPARTGEVAVDGPATAVERWSRGVSPPDFGSSPVIAGGIVYYGGRDGVLSARDLASGTVIWEFSGDGSISQAPAVSDDLVALHAGGVLHGLDRESGTERWRYPLDVGRAAPTIADGVIYAAGGLSSTGTTGTVVALTAETGAPLWTYSYSVAAGTPAFANGIVYSVIGEYLGILYALDAKSGQELWYVQGRNMIEISAIVANGVAYTNVTNRGGSLLSAFDAETGSERWRVAAGLTTISSIAVAAGTVVLGDSSGVLAFDEATGAERWTYAAGGSVLSSPMIANGIVYVGGSIDDGTVVALNLDDGTELWRVDVGSGVRGSPAIGDGVVVVATDEGRLIALGDDGGAATPGPAANGLVKVTVVEVLSGDTIRIDGDPRVTVRFLGIDAPNSNSQDGDECYSVEARDWLTRLLDGQTVWVEGETERDTDTRWNRYVWIGDDATLTLVNERLVSDGYARAKKSPLDGRYDTRLAAANTEAKRQGAGLWGACNDDGTAIGGERKDRMSRGNAARTGEVPEAGPIADPRIAWQYDFGLEPQPAHSPESAIVDGVVYLWGWDDAYHAYELTTGNERWRNDAIVSAIAGPAVVDGRIYVADVGGTISVLDAGSGDVIWSAKLGAGIPAPAVVDDTLYLSPSTVGAATSTVMALVAATGAERWRFETGYGATSPAVSGDVLAVLTQMGGPSTELLVLNRRTGELIWRYDTGFAYGYAPAIRDDAIVLAVALDFTGALVVLDARTGDVRWSVALNKSPLFAPSVTDDLIIASDNPGIVALDRTTGQERWRWSGPSFVSSAPMVAGEIVYIGAGWEEQALLALDLSTGTELWRVEVQGAVKESPSVANGFVVFTSGDGSVNAVTGTTAPRGSSGSGDESEDDDASSTGSGKTSAICGANTTTYAAPDGWTLCYDPDVWTAKVTPTTGAPILDVRNGEMLVSFLSSRLSSSGDPNQVCDAAPNGFVADSEHFDGRFVGSDGQPVEGVSDERSFGANIYSFNGRTYVRYTECRVLDDLSIALNVIHQGATVDNYETQAELREQLLAGLNHAAVGSDGGGSGQPGGTDGSDGSDGKSGGADGGEKGADQLIDSATIPDGLGLVANEVRSRDDVLSRAVNPGELDGLLDQWGWVTTLYRRYEGSGPREVFLLELSIHQLGSATAAQASLDYYANERRSVSELQDTGVGSLGDRSRALSGRALVANVPEGSFEASLYVAIGAAMMRVTTVAQPSGNPLEVAVEVASGMLAP